MDSRYDFGTNGGEGYSGSQFGQIEFGISFLINGTSFKIPVIGRHNMENALAATAVAGAAGISIENSAKALESYEGIYRRTQLVGNRNGIYVIDDFAHNPAEISAAIMACRQIGKRVIAWFQPHGYGPLKFMHEELAVKVAAALRKEDIFITSDVYYAGGTVDRDISPEIVIRSVLDAGKNALYIAERKKLTEEIKKLATPGDIILLMGARDPSLSDFALEVLKNL